MKKVIVFLIAFIFLFAFHKNVSASENNQFVTIVNPVRISSYNKYPVQSIKEEYKVISKYNLPATWLITYDVLDNPDMVSFIKVMNKKQEVGIFLEVSKNFAQNAKVEYHDSGFWHHANSVFLSGYTQEERIKLIDTVFEKFKNNFGIYPSSVGSWWTDSFSLNYMKDKYEITGDLGCSDQFSTDGYQIWGQFFGSAFFPGTNHAGIPGLINNGVVKILWAPRDPLNGYYSSMYSTQDYTLTKEALDIEYFKKLINLYAIKHKNPYGQITIGLEADLNPETYGKNFEKEISYINDLYKAGTVKVLKMGEFSDWYKEIFKDKNPTIKFETEDFLGSGKRAVWYQNSIYRLYYEEDKVGNKVIKDFRVYSDNIVEPYYFSPNGGFNLDINIPAVVDFQSNNQSFVDLGKSKINLLDNEVTIEGIRKLPDWFLDSVYLDIKKEKNGYIIRFNDFDYFTDDKLGKIIKGYSSEALHFFKQKSFILSLIKNKGWNNFIKIRYFIPQEEIWALNFLKTQAKGKVLVYDGECLQCGYSTEIKPLFFSNQRNYIEKYSNKKVVYNSSLFLSDDRKQAYDLLRQLKIKYIYLIKFEDYKEILPFSPGDLGVEKIFENANTQIWRVK